MVQRGRTLRTCDMGNVMDWRGGRMFDMVDPFSSPNGSPNGWLGVGELRFTIDLDPSLPPDIDRRPSNGVAQSKLVDPLEHSDSTSLPPSSARLRYMSLSTSLWNSSDSSSSSTVLCSEMKKCSDPLHHRTPDVSYVRRQNVLRDGASCNHSQSTVWNRRVGTVLIQLQLTLQLTPIYHQSNSKRVLERSSQ